jgi:ABC-type branched-subunit amino acid transport system substrate-binding protein
MKREYQKGLEKRSQNTSAAVCALGVALMAATLAMATPAEAQKSYGPGVSDTEIKIGNIMPYSGPASSYGTIGKAQAAYFKKINDEGGVNGRKINFISYDDGYSPPKAIEQARKLVESDEVLLIFQSLGTPSNSAIQKYLNSRKVPQLFVASGATEIRRPEELSLDHGVAADIPKRRPRDGAIHSGEIPEFEDSRILAK